MLEAREYDQHHHDVWTSPYDADHFDGVVQNSDDWALTRGSVVILMAGPAALKTLRNHFSDGKIIALWSESNESMRHDFQRAYSQAAMLLLRQQHGTPCVTPARSTPSLPNVR
ncbi:hypothetical protein [Xanthomonas vasicola]|uniref:hypothetical protein n=1 Tax=Xanthomonas vasicola TaxID=56459 RepID=UPI00155AFCCE|nr:hypothetical protein [Xanthomonas vasicola]